MTTDRPTNYLPSDEDLDAEEAALAAEDTTAGPLVFGDDQRESRRRRVPEVLAALGLDGPLGAPPRSAIAERATAPSLAAWADDPLGTLPPLRLAEHRRGSAFPASVLARALAPDLAARGFAVTARGRFLREGVASSVEEILDAARAIVREAIAAAPLAVSGAATEPRPIGSVFYLPGEGPPSHRPAPRVAEHLARLGEHAEHTAARLDLDPERTNGHAARAWSDFVTTEAALSRPHHDTTAAEIAEDLDLTLGDLDRPRTAGALVAPLRDLLPGGSPVTSSATPEDTEAPDTLDAARGWLSGLGSVVARSGLLDRYAEAGSPGGDLSRSALYALAAEVIGPPRKRRGSWHFVRPFTPGGTPT